LRRIGGGTGGPEPRGRRRGVFAAIVTLTVVAYAVTVSAVNLWLAVDLLAYPVAGVAPFVVITGAILTIPIDPDGAGLDEAVR